MALNRSRSAVTEPFIRLTATASDLLPNQASWTTLVAGRQAFRVIWNKARLSVGLPNLHFHDLRHTGGTLSAATGASLKELMARLGHSSVRAAMIYQHATRDRDWAIARALGGLFREARGTGNHGGEYGRRDA